MHFGSLALLHKASFTDCPCPVTQRHHRSRSLPPCSQRCSVDVGGFQQVTFKTWETMALSPVVFSIFPVCSWNIFWISFVIFEMKLPVGLGIPSSHWGWSQMSHVKIKSLWTRIRHASAFIQAFQRIFLETSVVITKAFPGKKYTGVREQGPCNSPLIFLVDIISLFTYSDSLSWLRDQFIPDLSLGRPMCQISSFTPILACLSSHVTMCLCMDAWPSITYLFLRWFHLPTCAIKSLKSKL